MNSPKRISWMQLLRPANVVTAISDVLAGVALACLFLQLPLPAMQTLCYLGFSTLFLYAGGIVFNDVFDADLDLQERPERPIPSGRVSRMAAAYLGSICFVIGCVFAYLVALVPFYVALAIVLMCFVYNMKAKHHFLFGPVVMGSCRALNLLLGFAVFPAALDYAYVGLIPLIYIASVTNISRGEVYGDHKKAMRVSAVLYLLVIAVLIYLTWASKNYLAFLFIGGFSLMIFKPLAKALKTGLPADIRKSVKSGVMALILLNASWIAISGFWIMAIFVLLLLPISISLAQKFAVT